jgi:hypothetical protein
MADRIMSLLAVAFIYERKKKKTNPDKENASKSFLKAMSLWTDWREQKENIRRRIEGKMKRRKK